MTDSTTYFNISGSFSFILSSSSTTLFSFNLSFPLPPPYLSSPSPLFTPPPSLPLPPPSPYSPPSSFLSFITISFNFSVSFVTVFSFCSPSSPPPLPPAQSTSILIPSSSHPSPSPSVAPPSLFPLPNLTQLFRKDPPVFQLWSLKKTTKEPKFSHILGFMFFTLVTLRISGEETVTATDRWQSTAWLRQEHVDIKPPHGQNLRVKLRQNPSSDVRSFITPPQTFFPPLTVHYSSAPSIGQPFADASKSSSVNYPQSSARDWGFKKERVQKKE